MRSVADCHNLGTGVRYPARVKLLLRDTVDDMLLCRTDRTDNVELVILPGKVVLVHIHNVVGVVYSENGVGRVPEN